MTVLYFILPLALLFAGTAVAAFVWTVRSGQLDDVDTPPRRILFEDERADRSRTSTDRNATQESAMQTEHIRDTSRIAAASPRCWPLIAVAIAFGVVLGLVGFTFRYAEGLSYFSTEPGACANCHIMRQQYDGWQKASHHGVATCVDCHLPHRFFAKYLAKASNGWHHSKGFTLQDFEEPIRIKPGNSAILQDNCLRCHEAMVHELVTGSRSDRDAVECVHCHASVGHGDRAGLGGPLRDEERK